LTLTDRECDQVFKRFLKNKGKKQVVVAMGIFAKVGMKFQ
jgi:hypothetical protein